MEITDDVVCSLWFGDGGRLTTCLLKADSQVGDVGLRLLLDPLYSHNNYTYMYKQTITQNDQRFTGSVKQTDNQCLHCQIGSADFWLSCGSSHYAQRPTNKRKLLHLQRSMKPINYGRTAMQFQRQFTKQPACTLQQVGYIQLRAYTIHKIFSL